LPSATQLKIRITICQMHMRHVQAVNRASNFDSPHGWTLNGWKSSGIIDFLRI